jgi:hypothetical protein
MAILSWFQDFFYRLNDQAKGRGGFFAASLLSDWLCNLLLCTANSVIGSTPKTLKDQINERSPTYVFANYLAARPTYVIVVAISFKHYLRSVRPGNEDSSRPFCWFWNYFHLNISHSIPSKPVLSKLLIYGNSQTRESIVQCSH